MNFIFPSALARRVAYFILAIFGAAIASTAAHADANADIERMVNKLLPIAEQLLADHGEFYPFGGALKSDDELVTLSGIDGLNNDSPESSEVIGLLKMMMQIGAENNDYTATAIISNVNVVPPGKKEPSDAVAIALEHRAGPAIVLVFPYVMEDIEVKFGDLFAQGAQREIFQEAAAAK